MNFSLQTDKFYVVGNNLALDFINSAAHEITPENLLSWAIAVKLSAPDEAENLFEKWREKDLREITRFRKNLRETVVKIAAGEKIVAAEIDSINKILRQTNGYSELRQTAEGFAKNFVIDLGDPRKILAPVAESFADLLCYGNLEYLRKCEGKDCVLYFYDTTKNHRRRWCSMTICGNRAKAAKFYRRKKSSA